MNKNILSITLLLLVIFGVAIHSNATPLFQQSFKEDQKCTFSVFPNPMNDKATITLNLLSDEMVKIEFFDITGKKVQELEEKYRFAGEYKIQIEVNKLREGIYFCKVSAGKWSNAKRLIIRH